MVTILRNRAGLTLMELLITLALISVVFLGAISLYTTGLRFLGRQGAVDVSIAPTASLEQVARNITVANNVTLTLGNMLNVRVDSNCAGAANGTPANTGDDTWRHYRFFAGDLLSLCDGTENPAPPPTAPGNPAGTATLIDNVDVVASTFTLSNPSGSGANTVVSIHLVATTPNVTIDTEVAAGALPKR